jgi:hypothetical protein
MTMGVRHTHHRHRRVEDALREMRDPLDRRHMEFDPSASRHETPHSPAWSEANVPRSTYRLQCEEGGVVWDGPINIHPTLHHKVAIALPVGLRTGQQSSARDIDFLDSPRLPSFILMGTRHRRSPFGTCMGSPIPRRVSPHTRSSSRDKPLRAHAMALFATPHTLSAAGACSAKRTPTRRCMTSVGPHVS